MNINSNSKVIYFEEKNLSDKDYCNLYLPDGYGDLATQITKYQGDYYYYKQVSNKMMLHELIGCTFAKKIGLDTVQYRIGKKEENSVTLYALSKIFFEKGFYYQDCYTTYGTISEKLFTDFEYFLSYFYLNNCKLLERVEDYNMILKILKLTAVDLKMGQIDRHNRNLFLKLAQDGSIDLAPIYDYECSYCQKPVPDAVYDNPFLILRKNKISLNSFASKFPEFRAYASFLEKISIDEVFNDIEKEHIVVIPDGERNFYRKMDQKYNKVLKKIIR